MAKLRRLPAADGADAVLEALDSDGGAVVEGLLGPETVAAINDDLEAHLAAADPAMRHINPAIDAFFGKRTRHVTGLAGKSRHVAIDVMCHPLLLEVCDRLLLPSCASYQLNLAHLMDRGPGAEQQWLHRDEDVWVHVPRPHPELQVACLVALEDFRAENGATVIVPGSHRWPRERQPGPEESAVAEMSAGSAAIYLGSTIHAGGANTTEDRWRRGVHLSYVVGWLRTEENNVLAVPPDVAKTLPRRAQELCGYGIHDAIQSAGGYLGLVDMRVPADLLAEGGLEGARQL
jgi:ectoine hydroxylase-related dioxygenase (phytanoyl-CoA dioxygenase family)